MFHNVCEEVSNHISRQWLAPDLRNRLLGELAITPFAEYNDLKKMSERQKKAWGTLINDVNL